MAIFRTAAGLSQLQLSQMLGCSQTTIWRLEAGERKSLYDIRELLRFADTVGMPRLALLPLILGRERGNGARSLDAASSMAAGLGLDYAGVDIAVPAQVRTASTGYLLACVERLHLQDQIAGGGSIRGQALRLWSQAVRQLDEADYDDLAGRELLTAAGELAALAGWACQDSDEHDLARRLYADGQLRAGQVDDDRLAVHTMVDQALLFTELASPASPGLGRQAVGLTARCAELARRDSSPRLHALIAAREAISCAAVRDRAGFVAAAARAWREVDRDHHDDDPAWLGFVCPAEIAGHEAKGLAFLDDPGAAELYRNALRDSGLSARNAANYRAQLARVLTADDPGQAVSEGAAVLDLLDGGVSSLRTFALLRPVRTAAGQAGLADFCERYDTVASAAQPDRDKKASGDADTALAACG
jgi:transcriptional regulator with XRE-family HTH domain